MGDPNEIAALRASFRGALAAAEALGALKDRVEALTGAADLDPALLGDLGRLAAANATAAAALRGFVETMAARRPHP